MQYRYITSSMNHHCAVQFLRRHQFVSVLVNSPSQKHGVFSLFTNISRISLPLVNAIKSQPLAKIQHPFAARSSANLRPHSASRPRTSQRLHVHAQQGPVLKFHLQQYMWLLLYVGRPALLLRDPEVVKSVLPSRISRFFKSTESSSIPAPIRSSLVIGPSQLARPRNFPDPDWSI